MCRIIFYIIAICNLLVTLMSAKNINMEKYEVFSNETKKIKQTLTIFELSEKSMTFKLTTDLKSKHQTIVIEGSAKNIDSDNGSEFAFDEISGFEIPINVYLFEDKNYSFEIGLSRTIGKIFIKCYDPKKQCPNFGLKVLQRRIREDSIDRNSNITTIIEQALHFAKYSSQETRSYKKNKKNKISYEKINKYCNDRFSINVWFLTYYEIYFEIKSSEKDSSVRKINSGFAFLQNNKGKLLYKQLLPNGLIRTVKNPFERDCYIQYCTNDDKEPISILLSSEDASSLRIVQINPFIETTMSLLSNCLFVTDYSFNKFR